MELRRLAWQTIKHVHKFVSLAVQLLRNTLARI